MRRLTARPRTLRYALAWLLIGSLAPLLLLSALFLWHHWALQRDASINRLHDAALTLQLSVDRELALHQATLQVLSTSVSIDTADWPAFYAAAKEASAVRSDTWVILGDQSGRTLVNTAVPYGRPLPRFLPLPPAARVDWRGRSLPWFDTGVLADPLTSDGTRIGNLFYGPVVEGPAVGVSIPVKRHGQTLYSLAFLYPPEAFVRLLQKQPQAKDMMMGIIDGNGLYIAHSRDLDMTGRPAPTLVEGQGQRRSDDLLAHVRLDDRPYYIMHRKSGLADWTMMVAVPEAAVLAPVRRSLMVWLAGLLLAAGVAAMLAYRFWRSVALPMGELARRARDEATRLADMPGSRIIEVDALHAALRKAALSDRSRLHETQGRLDAEQQAHREAQESAARMHALIEASPLGIAITDPDGHPTFYNPTCEAMHGMNLAQASGRGWAEAVHPDDRQRVAASWYEAAGSRRPWCETYRFRHADGKVIWVSCRAAPINVEGRHVGYVGTFADITALKSAEEALRASEAKLRRIVESGMVGVFYWNRLGDITDANDCFLSMLGYSREDLAHGRLNMHRLTPPEWRARDEAKLEAVRQTGLASQWEKEFYAADGRAVCVLIAKAMLAGVPDSGIAVCVDMTERKRAEREREELLGREHRARVQAESVARLRDQMMAVVAHDLRNPLHTIAMSIAAMQQLTMTDDQRMRQLEIMHRTAAGMNGLIDDLLDVARLESDQLPIDRARVDVGSLFDEVSELFEADARGHEIELSFAASSDLPPLLADRRRLVQVLSNLVGNALKFTPPRGRISVEAFPGEGCIEIVVRDTGCGVAPEDLAHLFDRFWRGSEKRSGAGLGLFIARGIVEAHGGHIFAESRRGHGTAIHFVLPVASDHESACGVPSAPGAV